MLAFVLRRLLSALGVLVAVAALTWAMLHLLYPEPWAFDRRPVGEQFLSFLTHAARLDLATSFDRSQTPVSTVIARGLPADLWLLGGALVLGGGTGVATGAFCATHRGTRRARAVDGAAALLLIAPVYWVGLLLLLVFAPGYGLLPLPFLRVNAYAGPFTDPGRFLEALWLPWLVLAAPLAAAVHRMTRGAMTGVLGADHVRTARAKGVTEREVIARHALPVAATPVLTVAATQLTLVMSNIVLVETVLGVPGVYGGVTDAVSRGDLPLLQGVTLVTAALLVLATVVVDVVQAWLDPTTRRF